MRPRWAALVPVVLVPALAAPPALAQGGVEVVPNKAGAHSRLKVDLVPEPADASGETPTSAVLAVARGFRFDPRARAERCSQAEAEQFQCPAKSRIGTGQALVNASGVIVPGGSMDFTAAIEVFLAKEVAAGDVASVVVQVSEPSTGVRGTSRGRLVPLADGPFGLELRFELTGGVQPPPGVTVTVKRIQLSVGARRTVRRVRRVRGRRVVRRKRYHLIRNPRTCAGSWPYQVRVVFPSRTVTRDGSVACSA